MQLQILESIFDKGNGTPSKEKIKDITFELSHHGQISENPEGCSDLHYLNEDSNKPDYMFPSDGSLRSTRNFNHVSVYNEEQSNSNIRNWIRNIEQHASENVNNILVGNKADIAVPTSRGQALADEYGIKFFETSAKTNMNVEEVFFSIARDIKRRLADTDSRAEPQTIKINQPDQAASGGQAAQKSACCGS
ncbi:hypothetical protein TanjilG_30443 [Lupinus angustifolius]|nr:hypothetical protein TanjilG_30443 [Lupinus angustifolius]